MSAPYESIQSQLKAAMKAGERDKVSTLRLLLAEIKNESIRIGGEVDQAGFLALVRKGVKQRNESAEQYRRGGRQDLAEREEKEAELLESYLPAQVSEDEIRTAIEAFVAAEGLSGPQAIGPIMKAMLAKFAGRADGGTINRIAREILA